jgi:hypothetical protein
VRSQLPEAPRHARRKNPVIRIGAPASAAAALVGVAAAFVFLHGGSAAPRPVRHAVPVPAAGSDSGSNLQATTVRRDVAVLEAQVALRAAQAARAQHLAVLAAARVAQQRAAARQAAQAAAQPPPSPSPSASPSAPPSSGGNAASSPLGICIRNAEEGGSYAWGPGNGGGAYQFSLGTWEAYGGAASEFGVAGPAYQDQIFDNAIAAGGASNWTAYDGC